ncbi:MAG: tetraacyldisaccharide 4'-kinase, partial [Desulforhopalus sp.]
MSNSLNLLFTLGRPFSPLYSLLMKVRERLYRVGILKHESFDVPVISVGNLMLGGTGKSPTAVHVARLLLSHGYRPAIISRGYRGKAKGRVNIVSDGNTILLTPDLAGDEPFMLAETLPTVPVLTGRRRRFPCRYAVNELQADILILDDGFQHLAVDRDIDLVLFDGTILAGNSRIFPGGPLREPISALMRCDAFLITGTTEINKERVEQFSKLLHQRFPEKPVYLSSTTCQQMIEPDGSIITEPPSTRFFAFCGIANPSRFIGSLEAFGLTLCGSHFLKDHVIYDQALLDALCAKADFCKAEKLITTEKDFVKLKHLSSGLDILQIRIEHEIDHSLDQYIINKLKGTLR